MKVDVCTEHHDGIGVYAQISRESCLQAERTSATGPGKSHGLPWDEAGSRVRAPLREAFLGARAPARRASVDPMK